MTQKLWYISSDFCQFGLEERLLDWERGRRNIEKEARKGVIDCSLDERWKREREGEG